MGRGIVKVSLGLIEKLVFDDQVQIVEVCGMVRCAPGEVAELAVEIVIDGPGLPKVNDLGLPRPVVCTITEARRSMDFHPVDDDTAVDRRVRDQVQRGGVFAASFRT